MSPPTCPQAPVHAAPWTSRASASTGPRGLGRSRLPESIGVVNLLVRRGWVGRVRAGKAGMEEMAAWAGEARVVGGGGDAAGAILRVRTRRRRGQR
jgi:hypothetical protein